MCAQPKTRRIMEHPLERGRLFLLQPEWHHVKQRVHHVKQRGPTRPFRVHFSLAQPKKY
jgi:hypothetical protein